MTHRRRNASRLLLSNTTVACSSLDNTSRNASDKGNKQEKNAHREQQVEQYEEQS